MQEEIKKVLLSWNDKGAVYGNILYIYDTLLVVDEALQKCEEILGEAGLGIGYTSKKSEVGCLLEGKRTLSYYIDALCSYMESILDEPLRKDFKKNATETISRIHMKDFETDNTVGLTEHTYISGSMYSPGTDLEQEKGKLTFADFIGTSDGQAEGNGLYMSYTNGCVEGFADIFAGQYEAMKASGMLGENTEMTQQEFLEQFYKQGEFTHDSSNPFLKFVSSVLDITIIKPIIEACTGEDFITGEDLTDLGRGLKVVFAVVDLATLGGALAATKLSELGGKESLKFLGKTVLIDFASNTAACGVGALGEAFDWPVPITIMLSLAAGITVSISGNKMLFKNADGIVLGETELNQEQIKRIKVVLRFNSWEDFSVYIRQVGKDTSLSIQEKILMIQDAYTNVINKTDINIPSNAQYVKGFSANGDVIYDWPDNLGFDIDTIKSITPSDGLPDIWDRYGYMGGSNFADVPASGKYTYSERSIPYVQNEAAYHAGTFNSSTYFDKIDAISGKAASWGDLSDGASQIVTLFGGDILEK